MRNKFFITMIICVCLLSGFAYAELDSNVQTPQPVQTTASAVSTQVPTQQAVTPPAQPAESAQPMTIPEKNINQLKNIGQNTPQNKFLKFIIAMIGVIISALAIYGGLKLYKSFISKRNHLNINPNDERVLDSPKDFKTAINIFLNKTDI